SNTSTNCLPCSVRAISLDLICSSVGDPESLLVLYAHRTRRDPGQTPVRPTARRPLRVLLDLAQDGQTLACLQQVERRAERRSSVGGRRCAVRRPPLSGAGATNTPFECSTASLSATNPRLHGFHLGAQIAGGRAAPCESRARTLPGRRRSPRRWRRRARTAAPTPPAGAP